MTTRFGIFVPQGWRMDLVGIDDPVDQFEAMVSVAKIADQGPWDSIWLYDHFHTVPEPTHNSVFECWTTTAALARETRNVNVGQMVGCNGYRNPSLYAKTSSTVDVAAGGRLYAGIGAGWYEHEWKAYGYEWPELRDRMGAFREAVEIVYRMWTEDDVVYDGKYYSVDKPINEPKGARKPHPSLWIGGGGEKVTLKLVAKYADACNVGGGNPDLVREKLDILRRHCDTVGRDYDTIIKSTSINAFPVAAGADAEAASAKARGAVDYETFSGRYPGLVVGTDKIRAQVEQALEAGANYVIFYVPGLAHDDQLIGQMAEVAKQYA